MDRKSTLRGVRLSAAHTLCLQGILLCKKLTNKHSGSVIFRLVTLYSTITDRKRGYQPPTNLIE